VSQLLSLTHKQWVFRNSVLHDKNDKGLTLKDAAALEQAIEDQFDLGVDGLRVRDQHYITRGQHTVINYSGNDQRLWLDCIKAARVAFEEQTTTEHSQMRDFMAQWLTSEL
jgi:hypothetical protein